MIKNLYLEARNHILKDTDAILNLEQTYMRLLSEQLASVSSQIAQDFNDASKFIPFWINYPPLQRGRAPSGQSVPWQEVGETVIGAYAIRSISQNMPSIRHPGLPSGADIRFMTGDAIIHLDIKITGPNDRADEVVASPNQVSGDGLYWDNDGVKNSPVTIHGQRANMIFQPELPPFYMRDNNTLLCLTYFLKGVYSVTTFGEQPIDYLELICVPNGLLAFSTENYNQTITGLFIPGKDEHKHPKKRVRIRMDALSNLANWRHTHLWKRSS